ncbi:MAG: hypothetical protein QXO75_09035 [Nitrososphaerota archaeon]
MDGNLILGEGETVREKIEILLSAMKSAMGEIIMAKKSRHWIMEYLMKICILNEKEYVGVLNCLTR